MNYLHETCAQQRPQVNANTFHGCRRLYRFVFHQNCDASALFVQCCLVWPAFNGCRKLGWSNASRPLQNTAVATRLTRRIQATFMQCWHANFMRCAHIRHIGGQTIFEAAPHIRAFCFSICTDARVATVFVVNAFGLLASVNRMVWRQ